MSHSGALRRDAARNRDRIIAAARDVIATKGLGVGFNEIARHAGVGVGTVYRRFPDRETLLIEALADPIAQMRERVAGALDAERAWDGLCQVLMSGAEILAANLGLREVALAVESEGFVGAERDAFMEVGKGLRDRAIAEGDLRPDITDDDIGLVFWMITEFAMHAHDVAPEAYRRYLQLVIDGMRSSPDRRRLQPDIASEQAQEIVNHWVGRPSTE